MKYEVGQKYWVTVSERRRLLKAGYVLRWTGEAECKNGVRKDRYEVKSVPA